FGLAGEFFDDIAEVLPGANVDTVLGANGAIKGTPVPEVTEPGPFGLWGSTAILGGYIAAFTTLAVVLFQRRDITSE
ncbi:MAG TPA: hypothetical protein VNL92_03405, partial [Dehalococcoidia bacterium]|nr:hypothetical protein [Dehalococcoidia bacterium]